MLANCLSILLLVDVIPFHLELCFVLPLKPVKNVIREFKLKLNWPHQNYFCSFNGETLKAEASSNFPHRGVYAVGSYRNSPFVTGSSSFTNGLKTEILNYGSGEWEQAGDYPFTNGNRYLSNDFMEITWNLLEKGMIKIT